MSDEEKQPPSRAHALFGNQGMHANADFIAAIDERAIDYLEQAPVLALSFGVKFQTRADRLYVASRIGGPISRGERLRDVMRAVGIAPQLRKLEANALTPRIQPFVRLLSELPPSTLSQIIPAGVSRQRAWLGQLIGFKERSARYPSAPLSGHLLWIAINAAEMDKGEASDIADYLAYHRIVDVTGWPLFRMRNAVTLWHDSLAVEKALPPGVTPNMQIDLSDWPENGECQGFEFFKLSTPSMLMEEGRRMRHCVASYLRRVMDGKTHLYSMRQDMRRVATFEIEGKRIVQIKGVANRAVSSGVNRAAEKFVSRANQERTA